MDGINCTVRTATSTEVVCTTGKRPGIVPTSMRFRVDGYGNCATQGNTFLYVNHWSEEDTWGGEFVPTEGDSIWVPKGLNLLYDVPSTPILNAVIVEGTFIFPPKPNPNEEVTFDAHYIMVNRGTLEIGTEEFPYTNKLTITLYGQKEDPTIPLFGNKVIAVYKGTLDIHGAPVAVSWTELD